MLLHSATQLLTLAGGPQRGHDLGQLGIIEDGAVLIRGEKIAAVGKTSDLRFAYPREPLLDASGCVVMPGFVDAHTHVIFGGDRAIEFEKSIAGSNYRDFQLAGEGINATVRSTRLAGIEGLAAQTRSRLFRMFAHGTTTVEAKTGYGLQTATELRMLKALLALEDESRLDIAYTFLAAHTIPPEYKEDPSAYVDLVCEIMLPILVEWWGTHAPGRRLPFVDVYCEVSGFNLEQSRRVLTKAKALGFPLKIQADVFENLGGTRMAVEMGAVSADHLICSSKEDIQALGRSDTVAVSLPCTPFGLADCRYTPAHDLLDAGCILALGTDCNPGTAWNESMQFVIALACRTMKLTPAQAIAASTINAAQAVRLANKVGSLETGKQADILVLNVPDYRHLGYRFGTNLVKQVIKKGRVYSVDVGYYRTA